MSFSSLRLGGLALLAGLSACTVSPLYGPTALDPATGQAVGIASLAGRLSVVEGNTRTDQIVRNRLLFRLNGGASVTDPLYEVELVVNTSDSAVSIQSGTGVPAASLYRIAAAYKVRRLSDRAVIANGTRSATAPYDRSEQLFAAQRALVDARENAGETLAEQIAIAIAPALRAETTPGRAAPAPVEAPSPALAAALPRIAR